jgi:hypothetical protein
MIIVNALTPLMLAQSRLQSGFPNILKSVFSVLMYPGDLVALALSMGHVDDINFTLLEIANVAFYFGVTYLLLMAVVSMGRCNTI